VAKLLKMPSQAIIDGLKGTLDFYYWMGIPCVRRWPRSPGHARAPAVEAQWAAWSYASKTWNLLPPLVQDAYRIMAKGTNLTGRDVYQKSYITNTHIKLE